MRYFICILFLACALSKKEPEKLSLVVIARRPPALLLPFPSTYFVLLSICVVLGCHDTLEIEGASQPAENETLQDKKEYWTIDNFIIPFPPVGEVTQHVFDDIVPRKRKLCVNVSVNRSSEG